MSVRILYLVRHGQMKPDPAHPDAAHNGWPLTELGRQQARFTARRFSNLPLQRILHSPYIRATHTAQLIAEAGAPTILHPTPLLCECVPAIPEYFLSWYTTQYRASPPGATTLAIPPTMRPWLDVWNETTSSESIARDAAQVNELLTTYFRPSPGRVVHEVLVTHGNLLGAVICHVVGLPAEEWLKWSDVCNCSVSEVQIDQEGQMRLVSFNDVGHLPYTLRTDNERAMYEQETL